MPHLQTGTSRLYYEVHGQGSPVVLMHGVGGNHASWFNQVPVFAAHHQVIVFDQRGFGSSTDPDDLGRTAMAGDLQDLLDHLGIEQVSLVAQSMSGGAAVNFTCGHPHRVRSLTLADTVVGFELAPALQALLETADAKGRTMSGPERVFGETFLASEPALVFLYRQIASFNRYDARTVAGRFPAQTPEALATTGVPVLFIAGAEERRFPVELIRAVQAQVAGSRYVEIERAGHSVYFERPDAFNETVLRFLDGGLPRPDR